MPNAVLGMGIVGVRSGDPNIRKQTADVCVLCHVVCPAPFGGVWCDRRHPFACFDEVAGGNQERHNVAAEVGSLSNWTDASLVG